MSFKRQTQAALCPGKDPPESSDFFKFFFEDRHGILKLLEKRLEPHPCWKWNSNPLVVSSALESIYEPFFVYLPHHSYHNNSFLV